MCSRFALHPKLALATSAIFVVPDHAVARLTLTPTLTMMHRVTSAMPRGAARMLRPLSSISGSKTFMKPIKTKQDGADILHDPLWNKGMGMDYNERDRLHLRGLLPPRHKTLENQVCLA